MDSRLMQASNTFQKILFDRSIRHMQGFASRVPIEKSFRFRPTYIGFGSSIFRLDDVPEVSLLGLRNPLTQVLRPDDPDG